MNSAPNGSSLLKPNTRDNTARQEGARMGGTELFQRISSHRLMEAGAAFSAIWKGLWAVDPVLYKFFAQLLWATGCKWGIFCSGLVVAFVLLLSPSQLPEFLQNPDERVCAFFYLYIFCSSFISHAFIYLGPVLGARVTQLRRPQSFACERLVMC